MGVDGPAREGGAPRADFVHLHVHSEYSLLDGAAQLEKIERAPGQGRKEVDVGLIARGAQLGFPALALTDHGNLFGAIDFYAACQQAAITPIIGCELYVAPGSRHDKTGGGIQEAPGASVTPRRPWRAPSVRSRTYLPPPGRFEPQRRPLAVTATNPRRTP